MTGFGNARRRVAQFRICLERDAERGLVPEGNVAPADACYTRIEAILDAARVELEAAGPEAYDPEFVCLFLSSMNMLGRRMSQATWRVRDPLRLRETAVRLSREARLLSEHFCARIDRRAA
jgi:hypothetical protein